MNKKIILVLAGIVSMLLFVVGCGKSASSVSDKKLVVATTYASYDWAKSLIEGSDSIGVKYLVDTNVDLHSYQPSAEDIVTYKSADLVICIGGESEEWLEDVGLDSDKVCFLMDFVDKREEELVEGMQSDDEEEESESDGIEYDEHIWLSVKNAKLCVGAITDALSALDSAHESLYRKNCGTYLLKLTDVDKRYEDAVSGASCHTLLFGDRFPFRYMVDDYGLDYYAAFIGCSAESEADFETIAFLSEKIDELGLKHVCVIGQNHEIADAIINNTASKSQDIVMFDSMQSISNKEADNVSYLDIMERNLVSLTQALSE